MPHLELTLAILKPNVSQNPIAVNFIRNIILTSNFKIVKRKRKKCTNEELENFYREHRGKFFFNRLITFMRSGPSEIYILAKENAIRDWRKLLGPTKVYKAQFEKPESLRGLFGLSDTRNAVHGSDSKESAEREIKVFFPEFDIIEWYKSQEYAFLHGNLKFLEQEFVHIPKT